MNFLINPVVDCVRSFFNPSTEAQPKPSVFDGKEVTRQPDSAVVSMCLAVNKNDAFIVVGHTEMDLANFAKQVWVENNTKANREFKKAAEAAKQDFAEHEKNK